MVSRGIDDITALTHRCSPVLIKFRPHDLIGIDLVFNSLGLHFLHDTPPLFITSDKFHISYARIVIRNGQVTGLSFILQYRSIVDRIAIYALNLRL